MNIFQIPMRTFASNCYVIESDQHNAAVIDPGNESGRILDALREKNVTPVMVLLTHGHFDHIGAVAEVSETYGCPVKMSQADAVMVTDPEKSGQIHFHRHIKPFSVTDYLTDGQEIAFDDVKITVLATPGHSKGGLSFLCGDTLFTGDTLFNGDIGRVDLFGGNYAELVQSLAKLAALEGDYTILPGHEEAGTLEGQRALIARLVENQK